MNKKDKWQEAFQKYRKTSANASFAEFYAKSVAGSLTGEKAHATLGGRLRNMPPGETGEDAFSGAGRDAFEMFRDLMGLKPHHRVIDYGCGSLRVGFHMMNAVEPGNYFALDVTDDFIALGRQLIGKALMERKPHLAVISPESIDEATTFGADFVFSSAVAHHVHPGETANYFGALQKLTSKPGARLLFDVRRFSDKAARYGRYSWSRPLESYPPALPKLTYEGLQPNNVLVFRRPD